MNIVNELVMEEGRVFVEDQIDIGAQRRKHPILRKRVLKKINTCTYNYCIVIK